MGWVGEAPSLWRWEQPGAWNARWVWQMGGDVPEETTAVLEAHPQMPSGKGASYARFPRSRTCDRCLWNWFLRTCASGEGGRQPGKEPEASKVVSQIQPSLGLLYRCNHRTTGSCSCAQEGSCQPRAVLWRRGQLLAADSWQLGPLAAMACGYGAP